jgi:hypothetical protein
MISIENISALSVIDDIVIASWSAQVLLLDRASFCSADQ